MAIEPRYEFPPRSTINTFLSKNHKGEFSRGQREYLLEMIANRKLTESELHDHIAEAKNEELDDSIGTNQARITTITQSVLRLSTEVDDNV